MKYLTLTLTCFIFCISFAVEENNFYTEEDNVIVLTDDNLELAIQNFRYLLVEFYVPWCARCKSLVPIYSNASKLLKQENSEIRIGKMDATEETDMAEKYEVRSYPTVKFFRDGKAIDYKIVGRQSAEIVSWLKRKSYDVSVNTVSSTTEIEELKENFETLVVGFFKDASSYSVSEFLAIAKELDDLTFAVSYNPLVNAENCDVDEGVTVFKKSEERRVDYKEKVTVKSLREFIEFNRLPIVVEFGPELSPTVFERKVKKHVILFTKVDDDLYEDRKEIFTEAAKYHKGKAIFLTVDIDVESNKKVLDWFKLKRSDCPTIRLVDLDGPTNYKPQTDDWKNIEIKGFVEQVLNGSHKAHLLSDEIPEEWDDRPVKILVGKNFDAIARDKSKHVFVLFYAPWCTHCKDLEPVWDKLAEKFSKQLDVVIAKIDATANEVEGVKITQFPSLKLFVKNSNEIVTYTGNRTLERFVKFVQRSGKLSEEWSEDDWMKDEL